MKFILQYIRGGINKIFYKQKAIYSNAKKPGTDILKTRFGYDYDTHTAINLAYIRQILYVGPTIGLMHPPRIPDHFAKNPFETNGLLDLGNL